MCLNLAVQKIKIKKGNLRSFWPLDHLRSSLAEAFIAMILQKLETPSTTPIG